VTAAEIAGDHDKTFVNEKLAGEQFPAVTNFLFV
jgi:hypothetical protein